MSAELCPFSQKRKKAYRKRYSPGGLLFLDVFVEIGCLTYQSIAVKRGQIKIEPQNFSSVKFQRQCLLAIN